MKVSRPEVVKVPETKVNNRVRLVVPPKETPALLLMVSRAISLLTRDPAGRVWAEAPLNLSVDEASRASIFALEELMVPIVVKVKLFRSKIWVAELPAMVMFRRVLF